MGDEQPLFHGAMPEAYERHLVPAVFAPWAELVAGRVAAERPGDVLELAAGTGAGTRALAAALPEARIVASDISEPMLAEGRARTPAPVSWQQADAQQLPFDGASFDAVVCLFGVMFLPDHVRGYGEVRRVLRPGGAFVAAVWQPPALNDYTAALDDAARALAPHDPPLTIQRVAHGYHDEARIRDQLGAGGFTSTEIESLSRVSRATAVDLGRGFALGSPLRLDLQFRGLDPEESVPVVVSAFRAHYGADEFEMTTRALLITAR